MWCRSTLRGVSPLGGNTCQEAGSESDDHRHGGVEKGFGSCANGSGRALGKICPDASRVGSRATGIGLRLAGIGPTAGIGRLVHKPIRLAHTPFSVARSWFRLASERIWVVRVQNRLTCGVSAACESTLRAAGWIARTSPKPTAIGSGRSCGRGSRSSRRGRCDGPRTRCVATCSWRWSGWRR